MSRRQVDATDGIDDQHTTELEQITNNLQAMAADHTEDNTEPEGAVCGALNIVGCTSESALRSTHH